MIRYNFTGHYYYIFSIGTLLLGIRAQQLFIQSIFLTFVSIFQHTIILSPTFLDNTVSSHILLHTFLYNILASGAKEQLTQVLIINTKDFTKWQTWGHTIPGGVFDWMRCSLLLVSTNATTNIILVIVI